VLPHCLRGRCPGGWWHGTTCAVDPSERANAESRAIWLQSGTDARPGRDQAGKQDRQGREAGRNKAGTGTCRENPAQTGPGPDRKRAQTGPSPRTMPSSWLTPVVWSPPTPNNVRSALDKSLRDDPTYEPQAQERLRITGSLVRQIASDARHASHRAWLLAAAPLLAALPGFTAWLLFSVLAHRSVLRTVRALTSAAHRVADAAGQELARVAAGDATDTGPPRLADVPVSVRDDIGELAEAFNRVQVTAAGLLERQVLSRRSVAEMFGNIGRRVSNLTARQLALTDAIERGETDPEVLERLLPDRPHHGTSAPQRGQPDAARRAPRERPGQRPPPGSATWYGSARPDRGVAGHAASRRRCDRRTGRRRRLTLMLTELPENAVPRRRAGRRLSRCSRPRPCIGNRA
jgi:hypothetical protein